MKKTRLLLFILAAICLVAGASSYYAYRLYKLENENYKTVRIAESGLSAYKLPHYVALEKSMYREQKLKIKTISLNSEKEVLSALEKGDADVGVVSPTSLVYKKSSDLKESTCPVAFAGIDRGATYHLVARENAPLLDVSSIKNKVIITGPPESEDTVFLEKVLRDNGLKPYENVTIITNIPDNIKMGALKSGAANYLILEDVSLPEALSRGLFKAKSFKTEFPAFIFVAREEYVKQNSEVLQGITDALYMAQLWLKYHTPAETANTLKKMRGFDKKYFPELIENCYSNENLGISPILEKNSMEAVVKMLEQSREIPMPVKADEIINTDFARKSLATVNYIPDDKKEKTGLQRFKFW
ncbi:MAG: ABC transporter substrate-binding protein [Bacillota bacterium]